MQGIVLVLKSFSDRDLPVQVLKMGLPSRVGYEHVGEPLRESLPSDLKQQFVRYGT